VTTTRHLALFDFDGTLTTRDTLFAFVFHCRGRLFGTLGLVWLLPWLVGNRVGLIGGERAKARLLRLFFGGVSRERLEAWSATFADRIDAMVRPGARERLGWHREQGHDVWVVSASLDLWLRPWAERHGLGLLCTEARFDGDVFTGELASANCNGPEKERRIRAALALADYPFVYGYGDSEGDAEMLGLADEVWFRPFRGGDAAAGPPPASATRGPRAQTG
jgi:phosphatidylglycerophosphatase C